MNGWLIGCGGIGAAHAAAYTMLDGARLSLAVDADAARARRIADGHGAETAAGIDEALEAMRAGRVVRPDFVDLCVPSFLHRAAATRFLEEGIPVLCEKPMANTEADARAVLDVAERTGTPLMIAHVLRFWPEYAHLKEVFADKRYGELRSASFTRVCQTPAWGAKWYMDRTKSGMAPMELHIHDADFIHHLLGLPNAVRSYGYDNDSRGVSLLKTRYFYDKMDALIEAEGAWYPAPIPLSMRYRAVFDEGSLVFEGDRLTVYPAGGEPFTPRFEMARLKTDINIENAGAIVNEIAYFVDRLSRGEPFDRVTPRSAYDTIRMLDAELRSARTGEIARLDG